MCPLMCKRKETFALSCSDVATRKGMVCGMSCCKRRRVCVSVSQVSSSRDRVCVKTSVREVRDVCTTCVRRRRDVCKSEQMV